MYIKVTNDTTNNVARIKPDQVTVWEKMDNNRVRVFTADGYQIDVRCDIDEFDEAIEQTMNGKVTDITK